MSEILWGLLEEEWEGKERKELMALICSCTPIFPRNEILSYMYFCEDSDFCILDIQGVYDILHSYLNFHLQFCLHKIKSYDNLRCLQCLRRHQQKLSTFSSQLIFISLLKLFPWILKASRKKNEHFPARLIVSVDPPLWLAFCVGVLLTWYYDYMCSETDFTQDKSHFWVREDLMYYLRLVRPSRAKNLDHLYTGIYALWILKRLIKPTQ